MGGEVVHYYKKNLGDYAKRAGRLSMLQHGSYTLLIDSCYDREQFPTKDEAIEWTWASTKEEIEAVEFVLRKFFVLEGDRYVQLEIKADVDAYHEKAANNKRIAEEREAKRNESLTKRARNVNEASPNHKPLTINQEPRTKNQSNTSSDEASPSPGSVAFAAYSEAYRVRYRCDPVRNAKVNSIFSNLAKQLGVNAPAVAAWYVTSESLRPYTTSNHDPALLLRDAAGLHTRWQQGSPMSTKTAIAADDAVGDMDMVRRVAARFGEAPTPLLGGVKTLAIEERAPLI